MSKFFKKNGVDTTLFIVSSLVAFVMFGSLYLVILNLGKSAVDPSPLVSDKYYLNTEYRVGDPLITKQPSLRDILAGPIISANDPSFGRIDAPVTIVTFSDFQCSFCYEQEKGLKEAIGDNKDNIRMIWKDYPDMSSQNSESYKAAVAARCAGEQGKFWEYHDLLFDNNQNLYDGTYARIAQEIGLNGSEFKKCQQSEEVKNKINENVTEANALGISGVPFVYINDQEVLGQSSAEELMRLIDLEMGISVK